MTEFEYLLTCLMEECGEATQSASKVLRFGPYNYHPDVETANIEALGRECTDVLAVALLLKERNVFNAFLPEMIREKQEKVLHFMELSKTLGIVEAAP